MMRKAFGISALLGLIVLAPIAIAVGIWLRNRRAAREWARGT